MSSCTASNPNKTSSNGSSSTSPPERRNESLVFVLAAACARVSRVAGLLEAPSHALARRRGRARDRRDRPRRGGQRILGLELGRRPHALPPELLPLGPVRDAL